MRHDDADLPAHAANPDHAWKLLGLVNDWIRHADAKATATLAYTGALGTLLYNMVRSLPTTTICENLAAAIATGALLAAGILAGFTLTPRTRTRDGGDKPRINRLYFAHITQNYHADRSAYRDVLRRLTASPGDLTDDLADQIHANAQIATTKNKVVTWAIRSLLIAGAAVGVLAILIA